jgi:hypothetical protein
MPLSVVQKDGGSVVLRVQSHACCSSPGRVEVYVAAFTEEKLEVLNSRVVPSLLRCSKCALDGDGECMTWMDHCAVRHGLSLGRFLGGQECRCGASAWCVACEHRTGREASVWRRVSDTARVTEGRAGADWSSDGISV